MSKLGNEFAPKGQVYICGACGKRSRDLYGTKAIDEDWDESCMLHAVLRDDKPPAQKPRRQRCPGSGMTVHLQGLQIAARKAPCPECQALRPIAPEPDRTAVLPTHMREVKQ